MRSKRSRVRFGSFLDLSFWALVTKHFCNYTLDALSLDWRPFLEFASLFVGSLFTLVFFYFFSIEVWLFSKRKKVVCMHAYVFVFYITMITFLF